MKKIVLATRTDDKFEFAKKLGFDLAVNAKKSLKKLLDEVTPSFRSIPETEIGRPSSFAISACSET